jgi:ubiquinone/menaquinone biosynthesis C-methylase UbiE
MSSSGDQAPGEATGRFFGDSKAIAFFSIRTAEREGAFFLPYLQPGMRVLDVGCGPGTITVGLAAAVAPGEVVGIDRAAGPLEQARALAAERGVENARFETTDLYGLAFPDASFDAAFMHGVLEHLHDPVAALRAVARVVRPGGVIGVRSPDITVHCLYPTDPVLEAALRVFAELRASIGGHASIGRALRGLLREAELTDVAMTMSMESCCTAEGTRAFAEIWLSYFGNPEISEQAIGFGLADQDELDRMGVAWRTWAERPDAAFAFPFGEAVGRVG